MQRKKKTEQKDETNIKRPKTKDDDDNKTRIWQKRKLSKSMLKMRERFEKKSLCTDNGQRKVSN